MTNSRMRYLDCPCGELLEGKDENALVTAAQAHLADIHPHLEYSREQILMLSY
jgi:hypothetical protein